MALNLPLPKQKVVYLGWASEQDEVGPVRALWQSASSMPSGPPGRDTHRSSRRFRGCRAGRWRRRWHLPAIELPGGGTEGEAQSSTSSLTRKVIQSSFYPRRRKPTKTSKANIRPDVRGNAYVFAAMNILNDNACWYSLDLKLNRRKLSLFANMMQNNECIYFVFDGELTLLIKTDNIDTESSKKDHKAWWHIYHYCYWFQYYAL
jgi:hypothetical protein